MDIKEQVLNFIKLNGPILPVDVSKKLNSDIIYAGAILSDLVANKLIKISTAKIGGSPIYYVIGQEEKLSRLYDYLPGKEKEAYNLLKEKKVLRDRECEPAIRVALRQLKDFAFPYLEKNEVFWKWYLAKDEEAQNLISNILEPKVEIKKEEIKIELPTIETKKVVKKIKEKRPKEKRNLLLEEINSYLTSKKIKLLETKEIKKNEVNMIVELDSDLGRLRYFLYAKDKKTVSDSDLTLAYTKGQQKKLPVLLLSTGILSKKAEKYLEEIKGYLVFRKL